MIILTKDIGALRIDAGRDALCVRHRSYDPPLTADGCLQLTYEEFAASPSRALSGRTVMVVIGLNKIIVPGNRTKVGPLLLRPVAGVRRISVDRTLFVSEPWRAWFHFGCVGAKYREYTYSYLAETHWRASKDGLRGDPFSLEAIAACGTGVVRSHYDRYFDKIEVERVEMAPGVHDEYQVLKEKCFKEEHTASAIISRLSAYARSACRRRKIPMPSALFSRTEHSIVQTDLKVDDYLVGRLRGLAQLTDDIGARFRGDR